MPENALNDPNASPAVGPANGRRYQQLRKSFLKQRVIKFKPTVGERSLLERAVELTIIAEQARTDPHTPIDQIVRADHCANRARAAWARLVGVDPHARPLTRFAPLRDPLVAEGG